MNIFEVDFGMVYRTPEGMRETGLRMLFEAEDEVQAVEQAVDWCHGRVDNLKDMYDHPSFGAIKVGSYTIGIYDPEKRQFETRRGFPFFEWKCDWPGTLDAYVESFKSKYGVFKSREGA